MMKSKHSSVLRCCVAHNSNCGCSNEVRSELCSCFCFEKDSFAGRSGRLTVAAAAMITTELFVLHSCYNGKEL
jgi:hypothetical protein